MSRCTCLGPCWWLLRSLWWTLFFTINKWNMMLYQFENCRWWTAGCLGSSCASCGCRWTCGPAPPASSTSSSSPWTDTSPSPTPSPTPTSWPARGITTNHQLTVNVRYWEQMIFKSCDELCSMLMTQKGILCRYLILIHNYLTMG